MELTIKEDKKLIEAISKEIITQLSNSTIMSVLDNVIKDKIERIFFADEVTTKRTFCYAFEEYAQNVFKNKDVVKNLGLSDVINKKIAEIDTTPIILAELKRKLEIEKNKVSNLQYQISEMEQIE